MPSDPDPARRLPPAFVVSAAFGAAGLVLLVAGLAIGTEAVYLAGVGAGVVSLVAALVWREQLVVAWHAQRDRRKPAG